MGGSRSREDHDFTDSDDDDYASRASDASSDYSTPSPASASKAARLATPVSIDNHLRSLHLKYSEPISPNPSTTPSALNAVKLYLHIGGSTPTARWVISDRLVAASFVRSGERASDPDEDDEPTGPWCLVVGNKIRAKGGPELQLKTFPAQRCVDFVACRRLGAQVPAR